MNAFTNTIKLASRNGITIVLAFVFGFLGSQAAAVVNARGRDGNVIDACVKTNSGEIRVIGAKDTCKKSEYHVDWTTGAGQTPGGITGLEVVWNSVSQEGARNLTVYCPKGKKAIGGGVETYGLSASYTDRPVGVDISGPYADPSDGSVHGVSGTSTKPAGWTVRYSGDGLILTVYAICAFATP